MSFIPPNLTSCPDFLTSQELTTLLRISPTGLQNSVKSGILPKPVKISPRIYQWRKADIIAFLSGGKNEQ